MSVLDESEVSTMAQGINRFTDEHFYGLLRIFPYKSLPDITVLNKDLFGNYVCILKKFVRDDYFFTFQDAIQYTLKFCIANLVLLDNTNSKKTLADLFQLMEQIIYRVKQDTILSQKIFLDEEMIISKIASVISLDVFTSQHAESCKNMLIYLISNHTKTLNETICQNSTKIVNAMISCDAQFCVLDISKFILKRFPVSSELFMVCSGWIVENMKELVVNAQSQDTEENIDNLLKILIGLYKRMNASCAMKQQKEDLVLKFMSISNEVINVTQRSYALRQTALSLLKIILEEFTEKENLLVLSIVRDLWKLPEDMGKWPETANSVFLYICHLLLKHSRCPWESVTVLESISDIINKCRSHKFFDESLLKSIFFLYPIISCKILNKDVVFLGDKILMIASNRHKLSIDTIFSSSPQQFLWIMNRGPDNIKKQALIKWISEGKDLNDMQGNIADFDDVALLIVLDLTIGKEVVDKIIDIANNFSDTDLSTKVVLKLSSIRNNKELFRRLILMRPAIPEEKSAALELYTLILSHLENINCSKALKKACTYIVNLLCFLKHDSNASQLFTKKHLEYLLQMLNNVDDDTAEEILKLLKILMLIQKRNKLAVVDAIEINPCNCLQGSEKKILKSLDLLRLILTSNGLITLNKNYLPLVCQNLCYLCNNSGTVIMSYNCLTILIKKNKWLAFSAEICYFVEEQCNNLIEPHICTEFTNFLIHWINILKKCHGTNRTYMHFPEKSTILRYMIKSQTLAQSKIGFYMTILERIPS